MYKRFRIIKKKEKKRRERKDISEIEKLKKVLLNKLLLLIDKYPRSDETFMKYISRQKYIYRKLFRKLSYISIFFFIPPNVLGNFQFFYKQIVSVSDVLITCYKEKFTKMKALNT